MRTEPEAADSSAPPDPVGTGEHSGSEAAAQASATRKRIAIFIVTYNAANTLRALLDRIPSEVWQKVEEVFVFDDSSQDDTYLIGQGYKAVHGQPKLNVFRNEENLGYGGNQIRGYQYAISRGYDIVALLHGDGQYAPEVLPELLAPLERGHADAVFGSRMLTPGSARAGGMPLYKYVGNRILTVVENGLLGMSLSEFHSGYRLYSTRALAAVPFEKNTHDFHFDTQIIVQLHAAGKRIVEVPIPTYYGDEICHVNGIKYARDVVRSVIDYRLHELGVRTRPEYEVRPLYSAKKSRLASHSQILEMVGSTDGEVLDVGCGSGELGQALRERGHRVTGVDFEPPQVLLDEFYAADLAEPLPLEADRQFDTIILADVLEHMAEPLSLLSRAVAHLAPGGRIIVSLPNAVHWSMRGQVLAGKFEYTNRGILDRGHLRFFTRVTAERLFSDAGLSVVERRGTPVPWERIMSGTVGSTLARWIERADYTLVESAGNLFAYQHIYELVRG